MGWIKRIAALLLGLSLAACGGGGGDAGTPPFGGGGGGGTAPTAADLNLSLSATNITNSGTGTVAIVATAVDANRVALAGIPIQFSVDSNAVLIAGATATDASGQVRATIGIGNDKTNRIVTVRAVSGSLEREVSFQVIGSKLTATALPAVVTPGQTGQVQYRLTDVNENPMVGVAISISGNGIAPVEGVTGASGEYVLQYVAPAQAGTLTITATAAGLPPVLTDVFVQAGSGSIPNVPVGSVLSASVSANPSVVSVNTASTNNRSEIRALFLAANNAPIRNIRVRFDLNGDPNSIGGTLSSSSTIVYSDANGIATTAYIPGSRSSPTDGVFVRACWGYSDAELANGACPRSTVTTLTVISEALSVSIGTNDKIEEGAAGLTYIQRFVVMVVDSSGQAKADVQITPSIDLPTYLKGEYFNFGGWSQVVRAVCDNEDLNRNGVLETAAEDANLSGSLEPRKSDVAISIVGSTRTDASGIALLKIEFPQSVASWIVYRILVSASGVSGTEGRATFSGVLKVPAEVIKNADVEPAFRLSPYGVQSSPTVPAVGPQGASVNLCTNRN